MKRHRQPVLARMSWTVANVVGVLAVAVSDLVVAKAVLGPDPVVGAAVGRHGPEEDEECGLLQTRGQVRVCSAGLLDQLA
jgi:hypothetical protein